LSYRTNNALIHTFSLTAANTIGQISRSGTLTGAGFTTATPTNVTVNSQSAAIYSDNTFAKDGLTLTDGTNTFTAVAQDALGRSATVTNSVYLPALVGLTYNTNGNLIYEGYRGYSYKDDDTLNSAWQHEKWSVVYTYDGLKRLRVKKTYLWNGSSYVLSEERRYLYDGKLIIQERNGDNIPLVTYTRGIDLSSGMDGLGGIGGLLGRTDNTQLVVGNPYAHTYFHADGNGNVTHLIDTAQRLAAHYTYDPFGRVIAETGPTATGNRGQFSSKESDAITGLSYFGARFYNPSIGRWNNSDPAGFVDGANTFQFAHNNSINNFDPDGRVIFDENIRAYTVDEYLTKPRELGVTDPPFEYGGIQFNSIWQQSIFHNPRFPGHRINRCGYRTTGELHVVLYARWLPSGRIEAPNIWPYYIEQPVSDFIRDHEMQHIALYKTYYDVVQQYEDRFKRLSVIAVSPLCTPLLMFNYLVLKAQMDKSLGLAHAIMQQGHDRLDSVSYEYAHKWETDNGQTHIHIKSIRIKPDVPTLDEDGTVWLPLPGI